MISILQVIEVFRNVIRVQSPQPHTTKKRHLKQLQLFQISMAKDTGPKTALFWMTPRTAYREVLRSDSGWNVAHMLMSVSILANGQVSLWKVGSFFRWGKKRMPCMMRCPKWFFWRPCSWPGKLLPFRCCFSSDEYCIAACFMWASQPSSRHSSRHYLACKNLACFLPFNHFSLRFFWHKNRPLNTAFNPNSIQNQSEATTKKRLTDTPYLLAGIISKKSSSKHKVSLLFWLKITGQNSSLQGFLFGGLE